MISADARTTLEYLECATEHYFELMPVGRRDQWTAAIRDSFREEGININDPLLAQAAFAGAMAVAQALLPQAVVPMEAAQHAVATMRTLADKAEA